MAGRWFIHPNDPLNAGRLKEALGIHPVTAQILINRGILSEDEAKKFLSPSLSELPDPFTFPDMERASARIVSALKNGEKIAIYGDYDVDGVTGTSLLVRFLRAAGCEPLIYIPNRIAEGYGLNLNGIKKLEEMGASLIITVDCGTNAESEIEYAREKGIDVVVTDHHEVKEGKINYTLVNPKRKGSPFKEMAGCAVVFFLLMALRKKLREADLLNDNGPNLKELLDLVALGTIADIVPLTGINRIFAKIGLAQAGASAKSGIRALISACGLEGASLKTGSVAFRIAPRINAAGRLKDAMASVMLLTTDDENFARGTAQMLNRLNADRQRIEETIINEAVEKIEKDGLCKRPAIVLSSKGWHPGVIGIVASKIVETYEIPAIVINIEGESARGSARSVAGINVIDALGSCAQHLLHFGGHAQAAGLSIAASKIDSFRDAFEAHCAGKTPEKKPALVIDAIVDPKDITERLARELELLEPFGIGNPEPVLCAHDFSVLSSRVVGQDHLKMRLGHRRAGCSFDAIGFDMAGTPIGGSSKLSIAFTPQINSWNGKESVQLKIREILCTK